MPDCSSNLLSILTQGHDAPFAAAATEDNTPTANPLPDTEETKEISTKPHNSCYRTYSHRPLADPGADILQSELCIALTVTDSLYISFPLVYIYFPLFLFSLLLLV
jgi:hypothetical protein